METKPSHLDVLDARMIDPVSRRRFLALMGASLAMAGIAGCGDQSDPGQIVPYVKQPDILVLGQPLYFATAMPWNGYGRGVIATSHEGRPTKLEGNPRHPASLGATDAITQAAVLGLYDPDRSRAITNGVNVSTWTTFLTTLSRQLDAAKAGRGEGLRILTETVTSPTLRQQLADLKTQLPAARVHVYQPVANDGFAAWAIEAFGQPASAVYRFDQADVVVSLDSDFLADAPGSLRYARDFVDRRRVRMGQKGPELETRTGAATTAPASGELMNRLYVAESDLTITGAMADHRLPVRPSQVEAVARAIANAVGVAGGGTPLPQALAAWVKQVADDLDGHRGRCLVVAGESQPPAVHAVAHAINQTLGNVGHTVSYVEAVEMSAEGADGKPISQIESLRQLVADMSAGKVQTLIVLGGNPVYTAPADMAFAAAMGKVPFCVHLGHYADETSFLCHWHIPEAHWLEAWGDIRAFDGTVSIMQPLIAPLYAGVSAYELLAAILDGPARAGRDILRTYWQKRMGGDFERAWATALDEGVLDQPKPKVLQPVGGVADAGKGTGSATPSTGLEISFRPDPCVWDGRYANNAWLQELPKPISKLMWENAAVISPATAERLHLANEQVVALSYRGRKVEAPAWIVPGHADDCVTLSLGYGRSRAGRVGTKIGANAYELRTSDAPWFGDGLEVRPTGKRQPLACRQPNQVIGAHQVHTTEVAGVQMLDDRELIREVALGDFARIFPPGSEPEGQPESLYPQPGPGMPKGEDAKSNDYAWGMVIDLGACIGCNACVTACQAENNIPVVGKEQCLNHREMHWLRIDRYYKAEHGANVLADPQVYFQPVPCMQCENAPCEVVCPVNATVHDTEGLNDMVYNRCVGTRYCSNNCPYKVRRFNFYLYTEEARRTPQLQMLQNPEVTVRARGVMEKCTYCVQRISKARIAAKKEGRAVRDGEVTTACAQSCPTEAIRFGNLFDRNGQAALLRSQPQNFSLLRELNTRPRTTYLAKVRNPKERT